MVQVHLGPPRTNNGDLAQLVEHRLCKAGVRGSIPLVSTEEPVTCGGFFAFHHTLSTMSVPKDIAAYSKALDKTSREICDSLLEIIDTTLTKAEGKVWHGAPVWFINGNPVTGYSKKKAGVELLFWSGQDFDEQQLIATGKYKAAGAIFERREEIRKTVIKRWLTKSKKIQWDYANLPKNHKLIKLTDF